MDIALVRVTYHLSAGVLDGETSAIVSAVSNDQRTFGADLERLFSFGDVHLRRWHRLAHRHGFFPPSTHKNLFVL